MYSSKDYSISNESPCLDSEKNQGNSGKADELGKTDELDHRNMTLGGLRKLPSKPVRMDSTNSNSLKS